MPLLFAPKIDRVHELNMHSLDQLTEMVRDNFSALARPEIRTCRSNRTLQTCASWNRFASSFAIISPSPSGWRAQHHM